MLGENRGGEREEKKKEEGGGREVKRGTDNAVNPALRGPASSFYSSLSQRDSTGWTLFPPPSHFFSSGRLPLVASVLLLFFLSYIERVVRV